MPMYRVQTQVGPNQQERTVGAASATDAIRVAENRIEFLGWARKDIGASRAENVDDAHDVASYTPPAGAEP